MVRIGPMLLLLLLLTACTAGEDGGSSTEDPPERRELRVENLASGAPGQGPQRPRVVVASTAETLSKELGAEIPSSGEGTYLVAYRGERPTGGYSVAVQGAGVRGGRVTVRFALEDPPEDAMVTQAMTYPYVIARLEDLNPAGTEFRFVDAGGEPLDWPVRRVGG